MRSQLIRHQHLAMKLGIFIIGIASAFEASLRQLAAQSLLFLIFMLLELHLYHKLLFGLRKILVFLSAYWLFATIFAMDFIATLMFSARILYLLLVMVSVWAAVDKRLLLHQCRLCTSFDIARKAVSYLLSTVYFMREYLIVYKAIPAGESMQSILNRALDAGQSVHAQSATIANRVEADLTPQECSHPSTILANTLAAVFLFALVMVNSL